MIGIYGNEFLGIDSMDQFDGLDPNSGSLSIKRPIQVCPRLLPQLTEQNPKDIISKRSRLYTNQGFNNSLTNGSIDISDQSVVTLQGATSMQCRYLGWKNEVTMRIRYGEVVERGTTWCATEY